MINPKSELHNYERAILSANQTVRLCNQYFVFILAGLLNLFFRQFQRQILTMHNSFKFQQHLYKPFGALTKGHLTLLKLYVCEILLMDSCLPLLKQ